MPIPIPAACLALLAAPPVAAQSKDEGLRFDGALIQACLDNGGGRGCIGVAAEDCTAATPGGHTTPGMGACLSAEFEWWDGELNARYQALRAQELAGDAEWRDPPGAVPRPSGAEALRDMQRAWIAFRDAACSYDALQLWGGTGLGPAGTECRMRLTAEQALVLRGYLAPE